MTEVVMSREEWLKNACQRKHLDEASVLELTQAINKAATVPYTKYGPMQVYREWVVRKEAVEYTVFFRYNDVKYRADYEITDEEMLQVYRSGMNQEEYVRDKIYALIEQGLKDGTIRKASEVVS